MNHVGKLELDRRIRGGGLREEFVDELVGAVTLIEAA